MGSVLYCFFGFNQESKQARSLSSSRQGLGLSLSPDFQIVSSSFADTGGLHRELASSNRPLAVPVKSTTVLLHQLSHPSKSRTNAVRVLLRPPELTPHLIMYL